MRRPLGQNDIETYTGRFIDVSDPQPDVVCLEDVAHGLANMCRFGGQCKSFYSVAEHAVLCAIRANKIGYDFAQQLAALHHDDAEAYLGDIPRPIKVLLEPAYGRLTAAVDEAVCSDLNLPLGPEDLHSTLVRRVDNWALMNEARRLLPSQGRGWSDQAENWDLDMDQENDPPSWWKFGLPPKTAEEWYISHHNDLMRRCA